MKAGSWVGRVLLVSGSGMLVAALVGGMPAGAAGGAGGNKEARERGAVVFRDKGCGHCHGDAAQGTEKAPSLQGVGRRLHKAQIEKQVHDGGKEMPAFGDALAGDEMKDLVEYLAARKQKAPK